MQSFMTTAEQKSAHEHLPRDGRSPWLTWVLALLTIPAAAAVMFFATGAVMSTSGCTGESCRGPGESAYGVMFYGAPVVSVLVLVVSAVVARRRLGFLVPVAGLVLLGIDAVAIAGAFG
jgi:hypothetical protein